MIESFLRYIKFEKRYSEHTFYAYQSDLEQFQKFLIAHFAIDTTQANHKYLRAWIVKLSQQKVSSSSIKRKIAALKSYYLFLLREGHIDKNPSLRLVSPRQPKRTPYFLQEADFNLLLDNQPVPVEFPKLRQRVIIELLYATGIRRAELINLKVSAVNLTHKRIKVLGKRNKERIIPLHNGIIKLLEYYKAERSKIATVNEEAHLIITNKGKMAYPMLIHREVDTYLKQLSGFEKTSPHVLRHTFATHLLNKGADLNAIRELLGHANLNATQIYTHTTISQLQEVFKKAHPKA